MFKILLLSFYDFKRKWGKPGVIAIYLLMPVVISTIVFFAFGKSDAKPEIKVKIVIVNHEKSGFFSNFLKSFFSNEKTEKYISVEFKDLKTAHQLLLKNKIDFIIVIPEGFTKNLINMKETEISYYKNPLKTVSPKIAEEFLKTLKDLINYLIFYFREEINEIKIRVKKKEPLNKIVDSSLISKIENKIKNLISLKDEIKIKVKERKRKGKKLNFFLFIYPALSFFFLLFFAQSAVIVSVGEKKSSFYKRLLISNFSPTCYTISKIISISLFISGIEGLFFLFGYLLFNINFPNILILFVFIFISSLLLSSLFYLFSFFTDNEKTYSLFTTTIIMFSGIFGGSFLPVELFPKTLKAISKFSPVYHLQKMIFSISNGDLEIRRFGILALTAFLFFFLNVLISKTEVMKYEKRI